MAAAVTDPTVIGLLRGAGRPWLERLEAGFTAGFRRPSPDAEVVAAGGWKAPGSSAAAGVEVALYSTDRVDPQVLAAAHDAGLYLVGADPSLLDAEPDFVIAAVEVDVAEAMLRVAREVHDLTFSGEVYAFDLGSGVLDVKLNPSSRRPIATPISAKPSSAPAPRSPPAGSRSRSSGSGDNRSHFAILRHRWRSHR